MPLSDFLEQILDLLFPGRCMGCGAACPREICGACLGRLAFGGAHLDVGPPGSVRPPRAFRDLRAGGAYAGLLRQMVLALKSSRRPLARPLALLMVAASGNDPCFLVPSEVWYVPSERPKVRERGYNPAEVLALEVAGLLGRPVAHGLDKVRRTEDQDRLPAFRRLENVSGAFRVRPGAKAFGPVLLVDDVLTTGATANECSLALLEAGASRVDVLVAAAAVLRSGGP